MRKKDKHVQKQIQNLGKRLKQLRKEKGYTNYEFFAYDNKITRTQYGAYEKGVNMTFGTLVNLARIHNLTLSEFFSEGFEG